MALKNPFGVHGFIPGMGLSLVLILVVSLVTKPPDPVTIKTAFERNGVRPN
jgi:hypothetical protein